MRSIEGIGGAFFFAFIIAAMAGWVLNIIKLIAVDWSGALTVEIVLRIVGVPFGPLGAILGWL